MNQNQDSLTNNNKNTVGALAEVIPAQPPGEEKPKRKRYSRSFSANLQRGLNMVAGILEHLEALKDWGLTEEKATALKKLVEKCTELDNDQNRLKGELKTRTTDLTQSYEEFKTLYGGYLGIIKSVISQEKWVKFGISAKQ